MDYLKAFIVGGIICALVQILLKNKDDAGAGHGHPGSQRAPYWEP